MGAYSEMARVYGIDFFAVLSRGSQYRVESMMIRLTKLHNYVLISPSRQQVRSPPPFIFSSFLSFFGMPSIPLTREYLRWRAGGVAGRDRMHSAGDGAPLALLLGSGDRARLPIALPLHRHRLQLLVRVFVL
jgi:hypothetical protein